MKFIFLKHFAAILPVPRMIQEVPPETGINGAILMECLPCTSRVAILGRDWQANHTVTMLFPFIIVEIDHARCGIICNKGRNIAI